MCCPLPMQHAEGYNPQPCKSMLGGPSSSHLAPTIWRTTIGGSSETRLFATWLAEAKLTLADQDARGLLC